MNIKFTNILPRNLLEGIISSKSEPVFDALINHNLVESTTTGDAQNLINLFFLSELKLA
jgi:hypothetical protein